MSNIFRCAVLCLVILTIDHPAHSSLIGNLFLDYFKEDEKKEPEPAIDPAVAARYKIIRSPFDSYRTTLYRDKKFDAVKYVFEEQLKVDADELNKANPSRFVLSLADIKEDVPSFEMKTILDEWCSKDPESYFPRLLRGAFYLNYAWEARGKDWARNVPEEAWPIFKQRIQQAKEDLLKATQLNNNNAVAWEELIVVAFAADLPHETMEEYYQKALEVQPSSYYGRINKMEYLSPRWKGSKEELVQFIDECFKDSEQHPSLATACAHGYLDLDGIYKREKTEELYLQKIWDKVEKAYEWALSHDELRIKSNFVYLASLAGKYDVEIKMFDTIGDQFYEGGYWTSLAYYNRSRADAYVRKAYDIYWVKQQYDEGAKLFESIQALYPDFDTVTYSLADYYRSVGNLDKAVEFYRKTIQISPQHPYAQSELDRTLAAMGRK